MGRRKLGFGGLASTAAVRTRGDFGIIPSPYDADVDLKTIVIFIDEVQIFDPLFLELCYRLLEDDDDRVFLMAGDLFVREFKSDRVTGGAEAYTYLGMASYVKHEGSQPMNITWQLDRPIPAKFLKKTNKLVVG